MSSSVSEGPGDEVSVVSSDAPSTSSTLTAEEEKRVPQSDTSRFYREVSETTKRCNVLPRSSQASGPTAVIWRDVQALLIKEKPEYATFTVAQLRNKSKYIKKIRKSAKK